MKNSALRRVINNDYAFTVFTKIAAVLIGLISTGFSKRFLGPALEGQYRPIDTMLTLVAIAANLGLYQPYPYYRRNLGPDVLEKFLNIFSLQFMCYAIVGMGLALIFRRFELTAVCLIAPLQVLANQMSSTIMIEDVKYKNVIFFTARIVNTLVVILAFYTMQPTLLVPLAMIVIGDVITIVFATRRLRRFGNPFRADLSFLRKIFGLSIVAMLTTLLLALNYRVDELMLYWIGVENAQRGYYGSGVSVSTYGWLISDAFREVLFSRAAKGNAVNEIAFSLKLNFYITLFMMVGIALFGRYAILLVMGQAFLPAYPVTVILLSSVLSMSYYKLIGTLLLAEGKKGVCIATLGASALVNILSNLYAIPRWGIEGAAWSSVLSYTAAGAAFLAYFVIQYKVPFSSLFIVRKAEMQRLTQLIRRRSA